MGETNGEIRVLVVDDNPAVVDIAREYLEHTDSRFVVETETSAADAIERLRELDGGVDCIVSDYNMPGIDGLDFLETVRENCTEVPFILFTSQYRELFEQETPEGVTDLIKKDGSSGLYAQLADRVSQAADSTAT